MVPRIGVAAADLRLFNVVLWACSVLVLWANLIRHLALEWSVNPQYSYGWALPGLCVLLLIRHVRNESQQSPIPNRSAKLLVEAARLALIVVAYGFTRLIQEANPDWRLVSWLMAFEVVGLTLLVWPMVTSWAVPWFPLLFILVAVPWPTPVEAPVIQGLTTSIASGATEILGLIGIPAMRRGNVIEVGSGVVGIEEACSGIRSVQAALMIALFFGHWYRLSLSRKLLCVAAGFVLAFGCNLVRTTLLTLLVAERGPAAMANWHEVAGLLMGLGCLGGTWLVARGLVQSPAPYVKKARVALSSEWMRGLGRPKTWISQLGLKVGRSPVLPLGLLLFLGMIQFGTWAWYRIHESRLPPPVTWHIAAPVQSTGFVNLSLSTATRRILRADEATNVSWVDENNFRWQALFLHWDGGRVAASLARNHTPADCLPAMGHELLEQSPLHPMCVHGLTLPFRGYRARGESGVVRVFYCLWEDRSWCRAFDAEWLGYRQRLAAVLAGQRNSGQRSLELAVWGTSSEQEAEAALASVLNQIIRVED